MAITSNQIQQLYVAYYGRPADPTGLAYWLSVTAASVAAGQTEDEVLLSVSNSFGNNAEYTANFAGLNPDGIINKVYLNLFSHQPDPSGLAYWSLKLQTGDLTLAQIVRAVSESAVNAGNVDGVAYTSKVSAAESFTAALDTTTEILGYTGAAAGTLAKAWITGVNSAATLATAIDTAALNATVTSVTDAGNVVAGQTFMLTTGIDAVPGTAGNDTITAIVDTVTAANSTLTSLDSIAGGAASDTMNLNVIGASAALPAVTIGGVETVNVRATAGLGTVGVNDLVNDATNDDNATVTAAYDLSSVTGVDTLNLTQATSASLKAAATTNVVISGVTGGIEFNGGKDVTVTDATANNNITVGSTVAAAANNTNTAGTAAAGVITVTDSNQGTGVILVDGGTNVTVTASKVSTGTTTVGSLKAASGGVVVSSSGPAYAASTADNTLGAIAVTGGTSITVTQKASSDVAAAAADKTGATVSQGDITVTGGTTTTSVSVTQDAKADVANAADTTGGVTETTSVKFVALAATETVILGGLTLTANAAMTANEVATAFSNLIKGAAYAAPASVLAGDTQSGGVASKATYTGVFTGWTSGAASGDTVVFTSTTARTNVGAITNTGTVGVRPVATPTDGKAHDATPTEGVMGVNTGVVTINDANAKVTTISVAGFKTGSAITGTPTALATLTLANGDSAAGFTVADTADTLSLNLSGLAGAGALTFTAAPLTLNVKSTGANSAVLTSAATTAMNVTGTGTLTTGASDFTNVKTIVVSETAGLNLTSATLTNLTSIDSAATTGKVTATISGTATTYTGGAGVDVVNVSGAGGQSKAISLGLGDDTLTFGAAVTGSTATMAGGDGTDTLSMTVANADTLDATAQAFYTGFERLLLNNVYSGGTADTQETLTLNLPNLGFTSYVTTSGTLIDASSRAGESDILVLDNLATNGTVVLTADGLITVNIKDAATNTADILNLVLTSTGDLAGGDLTTASVETVNISLIDTQTGTQTTNSDTLTLKAAAAKTVNVTGAQKLALTTTNSTAITTIDGSTMTGGGLTVTSTNTASATTILGGAGVDVLTAATSGNTADVLSGGGGNDVLVANSGLDTLTGGTGNDVFRIATASLNSSSYATITDFSAGDLLQIGGATSFTSSKVTLGDTAVFQDYANAAMNALVIAGGDTAPVAWFQYAGNTYVVADIGADSTTFVNGQDYIVKITGLVDLSTATFNNDYDTIALPGTP